jgi:hypothetical protein
MMVISILLVRGFAIEGRTSTRRIASLCRYAYARNAQPRIPQYLYHLFECRQIIVRVAQRHPGRNAD